MKLWEEKGQFKMQKQQDKEFGVLMPVIMATIRLCKRISKGNILYNILLNHACGQNSQCFDLF